jgi:hypothetical protein
MAVVMVMVRATGNIVMVAVGISKGRRNEAAPNTRQNRMVSGISS